MTDPPTPQVPGQQTLFPASVVCPVCGTSFLDHTGGARLEHDTVVDAHGHTLVEHRYIPGPTSREPESRSGL